MNSKRPFHSFQQSEKRVTCLGESKHLPSGCNRRKDGKNRPSFLQHVSGPRFPWHACLADEKKTFSLLDGSWRERLPVREPRISFSKQLGSAVLAEELEEPSPHAGRSERGRQSDPSRRRHDSTIARTLKHTNRTRCSTIHSSPARPRRTPGPGILL